jgi:hypothetical protein
MCLLPRSSKLYSVGRKLQLGVATAYLFHVDAHGGENLRVRLSTWRERRVQITDRECSLEHFACQYVAVKRRVSQDIRRAVIAWIDRRRVDGYAQRHVHMIELDPVHVPARLTVPFQVVERADFKAFLTELNPITDPSVPGALGQ